MSGRITSEGVRSSVAIVLAYGGGAWLGGNSWIPLNHLQVIGDAAIAEIARVRLRQWSTMARVRTLHNPDYIGRLIDATALGIRKAVPALRDDHLRTSPSISGTKLDGNVPANS